MWDNWLNVIAKRSTSDDLARNFNSRIIVAAKRNFGLGKLLNNNQLANKQIFNIYFLLYFNFVKYRFLTSRRTDFSLRKVQISHFAKYKFLTSQSTVFSLCKVQFSHFAKYRFLTSQSTNFSLPKVQFSHFAKYSFLTLQSTDFSLRKVQIFTSQSTISQKKLVMFN